MAELNQSVEEIVAELTIAQREAILLFDQADFNAAHPARRAAMMDGLGNAGLRPLRVARLVSKADQIRGVSSTLTLLGLAVRNHLIAQGTAQTDKVGGDARDLPAGTTTKGTKHG